MYELYYRLRKAYMNWKRRRLRPAMYNFGSSLRYQRGFRITTLLVILTVLGCLCLIVLYFTGPLKPFVDKTFGLSSEPIFLTPTPPGMTPTPVPQNTESPEPATPTPDPLPDPTASPLYLSWVTPLPIYENAEVVATGTSRYRLNVRTKPDDTEGEIIGILAEDQVLYILEQGTQWHKIVFADGWGYAYAPYIRLDKEVELPEFPGLPQLR